MTEQSNDVMRLFEEILARGRNNQLAVFEPYHKQQEFIGMTSRLTETALIAGNKVGKTYTACMLTAAMVTGRYWPGYNGRKFNRAVQCWVWPDLRQHSRHDTRDATWPRPR